MTKGETIKKSKIIKEGKTISKGKVTKMKKFTLVLMAVLIMGIMSGCEDEVKKKEVHQTGTWEQIDGNPRETFQDETGTDANGGN